MKKIKITLAVLSGVIAVTAVTVGSVFVANATAEKNSIGSDAAAQIALEDAGINEADAQHLRSVFERDDGRYVFDVEFFVNGVEYDYLIDANLGTVIERDTDARDNDRHENAPIASEQAQITVDEAKEIALNDAGVDASEANFVKAELDRDDGRYEYDIKFYANGNEYEYEISAVDGSIRESDVEPVDGPYTEVNSKVDTVPPAESTPQAEVSTPAVSEAPVVSTPNVKPQPENSTQEYIGNDKAVEIALEHAGLSRSEVIMSKVKIDRDDGRYEYEIEFFKGNVEYEYEIDAYTGRIIDFERDYDDD